MKKYLFILILSLATTQIWGQCLLINFIGNDCSKCQIILTSFIEQPTNKVPVFLVFPETYRADSADLVNLFSNIKGNFVFSDHYFNLVDPKSSSISYLNSNGVIAFKKSLVQLVEDDKKIIDSLCAKDAEHKIQHPVTAHYFDGWKISENPITKTIITDSAGISYKYSCDSITLAACIKSINKTKPGFYAKTEEVRAQKAIPEAMLKSSINGYRLFKGTFYYTITLPYVATANTQDSAAHLKGHIEKINILVRAKKNGSKEYFPISAKGIDTQDADNTITRMSSFVVLDDSSFIFFHYKPGKHSDTSGVKYIALYKLKNDSLTLQKQLDNQFPAIYFSKRIDFTLAPTFNMAFDYPYFATSLGTQIADISTGNDYHYTPLYSIDYSRMDSSGFVQRLIEGKDRLPVSNVYMLNIRSSNLSCLVSKVDSFYFLNVFNTSGEKMKFITSINLNYKIGGIADNAWMDYDKNRNILHIENKEGIVESLPIELLIGKI